MLDDYKKHVDERKALGIPPLPLTPEQAGEVCRLLEKPPAGQEEFLLSLLTDRISPGVDPAAKIKAAWLTDVVRGKTSSPVVDKKEAVVLLGTMLGGYNIDPLITSLKDDELAAAAADALKKNILVYSAFDRVVSQTKTNSYAEAVLKSWAEAEWFLNRAEFPRSMILKVFKVDGETNTDDLSPAKYAWSRPDIPLHALSIGRNEVSRRDKNNKHVSRTGLPSGFCRRCSGNGLLPEICDQFHALAYRTGYPVCAQQKKRGRCYRGIDRSYFLQYVGGFRRTASHVRCEPPKVG